MTENQPNLPGRGPTDPFIDDLANLTDLAGRFDDRGWIAPQKKLSYEEWEYTYETVREHRTRREAGLDSILWGLGDVLVAGEKWHGADHAQAFSELDYTDGAVQNIAYIARNISREVRVDPAALSFWKHGEVASLPVPWQRRVIEGAIANSWTRDDIRGVCRKIREELEGDQNPDGPPTATETDSQPDTETCPLCEGKGRIHRDRAEAYFQGE